LLLSWSPDYFETKIISMLTFFSATITE
jgi:hypothetical protein